MMSGYLYNYRDARWHGTIKTDMGNRQIDCASKHSIKGQRVGTCLQY